VINKILSSRNLIGRLLVSVVLVSTLSACSNFFSIKPARVTGHELSGASKSMLLAAIQQKSNDIKSFKALARVEVVYRDRNSSLRYGLLAERPNFFRIEGLPLNGSYSLSVLTAFAERLQLVDHTNKTVTFGPLSRSSLEALLQIPADPNELIDYLAGVVPNFKNAELSKDLRVFFDPELKKYYLMSSDMLNFWQIDSVSLRLEKAQFKQVDQLEPFLEISYEHGQQYPKNLEFVIPDKDLKIKLQYQIVNTNSKIRSFSFNVPVPDGYKLRALEIAD
jgi:hypothetical protein